MAKTKISEYDSTAANNTDVDGVNLAEGCPPSGINNAIREVMAHLKDFQTGSSSDALTVGGTFTASGNANFTGEIQLNGSAGTAGQYLTSQGSGSDPTWTSLTAFASGMLMMWSTASAPSGWLLCNGSAVSRTTYSALFAVVGTTFGAGDGSTTFNLPDYRNKMPLGAGSTYSVGATGGSNDAIVVSHTHTASTNTAGSHTHGGTDGSVTTTQLAGNNQSTSGNQAEEGGGQPNIPFREMAAAGSHSHTVTVNSTGSSATNANLPAYVGISFIIKT